MRSALEEIVERLLRIGFGVVDCNVKGVCLEEVTEVCLLAVGNPLRLRLAAAVMRGRVVVVAVEARVDIVAAMRAFVAAKCPPLDLDFLFAMMTEHRHKCSTACNERSTGRVTEVG